MNRRGFFFRAAAGLAIGAASLYAPKLLAKAVVEELKMSTKVWTCNWAVRSSCGVIGGLTWNPDDKIAWDSTENNEILITAEDIERMKVGGSVLLLPEP